MPEELARFLAGVSLFENLDTTALEKIASRGAELGFRRGDVICRKGDPGQSMFIITNGIIEVFIESEGERQVLAHLRRGDYFGEMALLTGLPRSASVRSLADTRVFGLTKEDFEDVCRTNVDIALDIIKTLSLRLAHSNVAGTERGAAQVFVLLSMEPAIGKTTVAANMAYSLASSGDEKVAIFDPNLSNDSLAKIFGVEEQVDIASPLVSTGRIDVNSMLKEVKPKLSIFPPQTKGGPILQEFHYHVPFQALRDHVDVVVVDSSSTIAGVNREVIKAAEGVLLLIPADNSDLKATLGQFERMILGPANVDMARVKVVLIKREGHSEPQIPEDLGVDCCVIPDGAQALATSSLAVEKSSSSEFSQAINELSQKVRTGRAVELFVPITANIDGDRAKKVINDARQRCPELLHFSKASQDAPVGVPHDDRVAVFMVLYGSCSESQLRTKMAKLVDCATNIKEELSIDNLYLRVDGRLDTI